MVKRAGRRGNPPGRPRSTRSRLPFGVDNTQARQGQMNKLDMRGRTAVVTGGAAGIGLAIAERLVKSGAQVSVWDRDDKALAASAKALGGAVHMTRLDVSQEASV